MNMFTFEESPWELFAGKLKRGDRISAVRFLTLLEGERDEAVESAFQTLEELSVTLDISDLPKASGTGEAALRLRREEELVSNGTLFTALDENDPLRLYLDELAAIPACGDVAILARECAEGNDHARTMLVNLSLSRVVELAGENVGRGVLLLDLIQEGSLGLWQGILCYQGGDFEAHRDWWIRQYMAKIIVQQALSNGVGQKMRQAMEDYRSVDEKLLMELGRNATLEEIALQMHLTPEEAAAVKETLDSARMLDRAKSAPEPGGETEEDQQHVEDTAYFQTRQRILDLLSGLSEEDAQLLTLRFGLEGGLPLSPEDTGKRLGLTPEEVIARETAALAKLRNG